MNNVLYSFEDKEKQKQEKAREHFVAGGLTLSFIAVIYSAFILQIKCIPFAIVYTEI